MHGLFEVDIAAARRLLAEHDPPLSLTALARCNEQAAAAGTAEQTRRKATADQWPRHGLGLRR
jgi:hypothetical protein